MKKNNINNDLLATLKIFLMILNLLIFASCSPNPPKPYTDTLREALEMAAPGDVIQIPAGTYSFRRSLVLATDDVSIRGAGMDQTILSFKEQIIGAEGLSVNANNFLIEDLAIEDTVGDALKINDGRNITVRRVRTEWTNGPDTENGAYGIYPVQTNNVLLEGNVSIGASDAGIYVGQSRQVIIRNNLAEYNVAGIEVENTIGADVYNNVARFNTGGILVFNMPNIPQDGYATRVFENDIYRNNTENFAIPGSAVSGVPAGSGVVVNATDQVEIFNNRISNNETANIIISSYFSANYAGQTELALGFDPYPEQIMVYGNVFVGGGSAPGADYLVQLKNALYGEEGAFPDIIWDGIVNHSADASTSIICVDNGKAEVLSIDAGNEFTNAGVDMSRHSCDIVKLQAIELAGN